MESTFYKKVVDDLKIELKKYIDKVCSLLHFDITKTAVVVGTGTNGYNVKFDGNTYTNVRTEITGASFSVNSTCRVMIPEANYNNMFILGGASVLTTNGGGSSSFADLFFSNTNSSVSGYKTMNYTADTTATQMSVTCTSSADVLSYVYLYPSAIGTTVINSGNWKSTFNGYVSNAQGTSRLKLVCFVYHTDGTTTDLFTKYTNDFDSTSQSLFYTETYRNQFTVASTDRLGFRIYGNTTRTVNTTIYYTIGGTNPSYINTPIALRHNQLRNLNEDSNYQHITTTQVNQIATNTTNIASLNSNLGTHKAFSGILTYNGSYFPCDIGSYAQLSICARNENNGSIMILWYNSGEKGFDIGWQTGSTATGNFICVAFVY
jgi:hypothetical protein